MNKIAVIDSGISENINVLNKYEINRSTTKYTLFRGDAIDKLGHGTMVANIILDENPHAVLDIYKLFDDKIETTWDELYFVLDSILNSENVYDFINISCGITYIYEYNTLYNICKKLLEKGTIIVSAFDNDGAISYPACLDTVIGVDIVNSVYGQHETIKVSESIVNYLVPNKYYRSKGINGITALYNGTSFACAKVTGYLSFMAQDEKNKENLVKEISNNQMCIKSNAPHFNIKKAIIFPYNKESDVLLRNSYMLGFNIDKIYDEKRKGLIQKEKHGYLIDNYQNIDWSDDFDTVILSCTKELYSLTGINYQEIFVNKCIEFKKNIYAFEQLPIENKHMFYPKVEQNQIPKNRFQKLRRMTLPVVGVFGTSSKQGKFSLQLQILQNLKQMGYNTGFLSTEPSGYLFGADFVFPMGYQSTVMLNCNIYDYISVLNEEMWKMEADDKDIAIVGCQSGSIHYDMANLNQLAVQQYGFLLGTAPDIFILKVNPFDDFQYIERTIKYLNCINTGKVIALSIFPMHNVKTQTGLYYSYQKISKIEELNLKKKLYNYFKIPVFCQNETESLCELIINYFTED